MSQRLLLWVAAAATVALTGTSGHTQATLYEREGTRLENSNKMWNQNDTCGKESFQKFPDYTAEGAAKRDAYMRECLRKHHLPPRNDAAQPARPAQ
ncbi:MAG TPA: hypothetical protein VN823_16245 [Stellaceae bacterium]|nr:hypothetical protein [Stellaceae bacterium]